jgi:hypothetical protein
VRRIRCGFEKEEIVKTNGATFSGSLILIALGLALLGQPGCGGKNPESRKNDAPTKPSNSADEMHSFNGEPIGGTYCVAAIPQGPPVSTPVHFFNKETHGDGSTKDFESDLSADKLDVTFHERRQATSDDKPSSTPALNGLPALTETVANGYWDLVRINHYTRSNDHQWLNGANDLERNATPWGFFIDKPPVTKVGTETISGYDTIKYSVDTTHQSQTDKFARLMTGNMKDYNLVGSVWVAKAGACILQYQLDYEEDGKDGSVKKEHYEGGVTKQ